MPSKYTCDGEDLSPPLHFEAIPTATKSLALIVDDPDAPRGDWVHWLVYNIPPAQTSFTENKIPPKVEVGTNDFGQNQWGGPCPPSGEHHYHFKLFALDTILTFPFPPKKKDLEQAMETHILDQSELVGIYQRK